MQREVIVQSLLIVLAACLIGAVTSTRPHLGLTNGQVGIRAFRSGGPYCPVINLAKAKELFDEGEAIFLDACSRSAYGESHIAGALSVPLLDVLRERVDPAAILPDK